MASSTELASFHGEVNEVSDPDGVRSKANPSVEKRIRYFNYLPVAVQLGWRDGTRVSIEPEDTYADHRLIVQVELYLSRLCRASTRRYLASLGEITCTTLIKVRDALEQADQPNNYHGTRILLEYPITLDELRRHGGVVYFNEIDTVVGIVGIQEMPPHPFSPAGKLAQLAPATEIDGRAVSFGFCLDVVDNAKQYGPRYVNILGKVYRVMPRTDPWRRDGVYLHTSALAEKESSGNLTKRLDFANAEASLGLYTSYELAMTLGDLALAKKQVVEELEASNLELKNALRNAQTESDMAKLQRDEEVRRSELTHAERLADIARSRDEAEYQLKLEKERMKDHFEQRTYVRKDSSEGLKFIPAVVLGVGAVFAAIKTLL